MKYSLRSLLIISAVLPPLLAGIIWLWWSPWFWHVAELLGVAFGIYGFLWWISSFRKSSAGP
jgi:hypothetical protein